LPANVLAIGQPGVGKTMLAIALGLKAAIATVIALAALIVSIVTA
jgi:DNA replication protein DnaC